MAHKKTCECVNCQRRKGKKMLEDPHVQKKLEEAREMWRKRTAPLIESIRRSEIITSEDLQTRINT